MASPQHADAGEQTYVGGRFHSACVCGERFSGLDPDDADAKLVQHISGESA